MHDRTRTTAATATCALALVALPQAGLAHADTTITVPAPTAIPVPAVTGAASPVTVSTAKPGSITVSGGDGVTNVRHTTGTHTVTIPAATTTTGPLGVPVPVIPKPTITSTHQVGLNHDRTIQAKLPTTTVSIAPVKVGVNVPSVSGVTLPSLPKVSLPQASVNASVKVTTPAHTTRTVSIAPVKPYTVAPVAAAYAQPASSSSNGSLAETGSEVKPWVVVTGALLVVLGLDLVAAGRRRRYF